MTKIGKISKIQKTSSLCIHKSLFVAKKIRQFGPYGEELKHYEANFQIAGALYFPIHFAIFYEIGLNFETSYLCNGASFFKKILKLHILNFKNMKNYRKINF